MGSIQTGVIKENNCLYDMNIYIEKMNYFPGETIQGLIQLSSKNYINMNEKILSPIKVYFILKGIEYWKNGLNHKNETPNPDETPRQENSLDDKKNYYEYIIFSKEDLISNLTETPDTNMNMINFNKNEINIPIKIELPNDMKPSFEWSKEDNIYCYCRTIFSINIPELNIYSNYYLFIQKNSPISISPLNLEKILGKKSLIFFWDNDNIKIEASSQRDAYPISDICPFQIKIDSSELKSKLTSITLTLKRKIKFMVNREQSIYLNTCDYIDDLWEQKIVLENNETSHSYEFNIPLLDNDKLIKQRKFKFWNLKNFNKKYLSFLLLPYYGQMVKCNYFIKIKPIFEGSNISFNDFIINIDLYHNQNSFSIEAVKEINNIFFEINKMKKVQFYGKDNIINYSAYSSSIYQSLPEEEMIKKYYSSNGTSLSVAPAVGHK